MFIRRLLHSYEGYFMSGKVHRVKGKQIVKTYRLLPYSEILDVLEEDGVAFFEDNPNPKQHLNRGTIWKATRKISQMVGKQVIAERVLMRLNNGAALEGYLFSVANPKFQRKRGNV